MPPEALCFSAVRPSVRACARNEAAAFSDRLAVDFYTVRQKKELLFF